jgi:hypothetical protein
MLGMQREMRRVRVEENHKKRSCKESGKLGPIGRASISLIAAAKQSKSEDHNNHHKNPTCNGRIHSTCPREKVLKVCDRRRSCVKLPSSRRIQLKHG